MTQPSRALTVRALILGMIGSAILTASSLFIALKMGMLPWPIAFAAITSALALRALGSRDIHEANVTHAAMSAGAMIAGGLAFTVPGLWIMGAGEDLTVVQVLLATIGGTVLGLLACAALQPYFIHRQKLAYPIGRSAADTLRAVSENSAADAPYLFGGLGFGALWAVLRDTLSVIPQMLFSCTVGGVSLGMYSSPMTVAMGFMVGVVPALVWVGGAVLGHLGVGLALPAVGVIPADAIDAVRTSLGLGLMLGCGAGAIVSGIIGAARKRVGDKSVEAESASLLRPGRTVIALVSAGVAAWIAFVCGWGLGVGVIVTLGAWFAVFLSGWLTGTTGINPMEIFGMLVLLLVQAMLHQTSTTTLFLVAAVVAVACGIGGDVMNDLKAGDALGTPARDQFWGMVAGAGVGAVVAALLIMVMHDVYGSEAFGPTSTFVSVQAANVAAMAGGISHVPAFVTGIVAGAIMTAVGLPVMTLGLGVYLPFYMSSGALVGVVVRIVMERMVRARAGEDKADESALALETRMGAVASGLLGGESLAGVVMALIAMWTMFVH